MLRFITQTCCRCSLQTQTGTRIHNLNRPILKRTDEAVWSWGKCNWDWTATELKAPFFLKIPLLLGRHICASTWFRECWCARPAKSYQAFPRGSVWREKNSYPKLINLNSSLKNSRKRAEISQYPSLQNRRNFLRISGEQQRALLYRAGPANPPVLLATVPWRLTCEQQTYFRSSLLSRADWKYICFRRLPEGSNV